MECIFWGKGKGKERKGKLASEHPLSSEQKAWWNSPTILKEDLPTDFSEEQRHGKPCFDSLFCVGKMKTQSVQGQEMTSIAVLEVSVAFYS